MGRGSNRKVDKIYWYTVLTMGGYITMKMYKLQLPTSTRMNCRNLTLSGKKKKLPKTTRGYSLVAQWLRIRLSMQATRVRALVRGDSTCRGATRPVRHNYWACTLELTSHNYWAREPQLLKPARLEPELHNKRSHAMRSLCTATKE